MSDKDTRRSGSEIFRSVKNAVLPRKRAGGYFFQTGVAYTPLSAIFFSAAMTFSLSSG